MYIMIICHWAILHYNMSFKTIAGRSDDVFLNSPKLSCGFKGCFFCSRPYKISLLNLIFSLQSEEVSKLIKIPGIVIAASAIRAKATRITIQCRSCRNFMPNLALKPGLEGYSMPRKCNT